ncbi:MAG: helical backbone metal receptor [Nocardioides sp.]|nr:helical backbone metal receptor [Nocardioides sp.]
MPPLDDLGHPYDGPATATRVVSLVPSITEALASVHPDALVGVTDWCTHPADLTDHGAIRVRGTKNPDLAAIRALRPDVVVVNKEENRALDVRRLRERGVRVWVTDIETVPAAVSSLARLLTVLGWAAPAWLGAARERWCGPLPPVTRRVVVPVWRDPWMVVGSSTFTGDLLRRLGWENVYDQHPERYPAIDLADLDAAGADAVLLPDEPYVFTATDGPEAFTTTRTELVSGRLLTWYGPSLLELPEPTT